MRRMLTAKLQNRSGVLNRFTGVLSRRQVNIESISVGATENPNVSRITIIIDVASHDEVEQIIKQLNRQIDVIRIRDITDKPHLEREVIEDMINRGVLKTKEENGEILIEASEGTMSVVPSVSQNLSLQPQSQDGFSFVEKTIGTILNLHEKVLDAKDETLETLRNENKFLKS